MAKGVLQNQYGTAEEQPIRVNIPKQAIQEEGDIEEDIFTENINESAQEEKDLVIDFFQEIADEVSYHANGGDISNLSLEKEGDIEKKMYERSPFEENSDEVETFQMIDNGEIEGRKISLNNIAKIENTHFADDNLEKKKGFLETMFDPNSPLSKTAILATDVATAVTAGTIVGATSIATSTINWLTHTSLVESVIGANTTFAKYIAELDDRIHSNKIYKAIEDTSAFKKTIKFMYNGSHFISQLNAISKGINVINKITKASFAINATQKALSFTSNGSKIVSLTTDFIADAGKYTLMGTVYGITDKQKMIDYGNEIGIDGEKLYNTFYGTITEKDKIENILEMQEGYRKYTRNLLKEELKQGLELAAFDTAFKGVLKGVKKGIPKISEKIFKKKTPPEISVNMVDKEISKIGKVTEAEIDKFVNEEAGALFDSHLASIDAASKIDQAQHLPMKEYLGEAIEVSEEMLSDAKKSSNYTKVSNNAENINANFSIEQLKNAIEFEGVEAKWGEMQRQLGQIEEIKISETARELQKATNKQALLFTEPAALAIQGYIMSAKRIPENLKILFAKTVGYNADMTFINIAKLEKKNILYPKLSKEQIFESLSEFTGKEGLHVFEKMWEKVIKEDVKKTMLEYVDLYLSSKESVPAFYKKNELIKKYGVAGKNLDSYYDGLSKAIDSLSPIEARKMGIKIMEDNIFEIKKGFEKDIVEMGGNLAKHLRSSIGTSAELKSGKWLYNDHLHVSNFLTELEYGILRFDEETTKGYAKILGEHYLKNIEGIKIKGEKAGETLKEIQGMNKNFLLQKVRSYIDNVKKSRPDLLKKLEGLTDKEMRTITNEIGKLNDISSALSSIGVFPPLYDNLANEATDFMKMNEFTTTLMTNVFEKDLGKSMDQFPSSIGFTLNMLSDTIIKKILGSPRWLIREPLEKVGAGLFNFTRKFYELSARKLIDFHYSKSMSAKEILSLAEKDMTRNVSYKELLAETGMFAREWLEDLTDNMITGKLFTGKVEPLAKELRYLNRGHLTDFNIQKEEFLVSGKLMSKVYKVFNNHITNFGYYLQEAGHRATEVATMAKYVRRSMRRGAIGLEQGLKMIEDIKENPLGAFEIMKDTKGISELIVHEQYDAIMGLSKYAEEFLQNNKHGLSQLLSNTETFNILYNEMLQLNARGVSNIAIKQLHKNSVVSRMQQVPFLNVMFLGLNARLSTMSKVLEPVISTFTEKEASKKIGDALTIATFGALTFALVKNGNIKGRATTPQEIKLRKEKGEMIAPHFNFFGVEVPLSYFSATGAALEMIGEFGNVMETASNFGSLLFHKDAEDSYTSIIFDEIAPLLSKLIKTTTVEIEGAMDLFSSILSLGDDKTAKRTLYRFLSQFEHISISNKELTNLLRQIDIVDENLYKPLENMPFIRSLLFGPANRPKENIRNNYFKDDFYEVTINPNFGEEITFKGAGVSALWQPLSGRKNIEKWFIEDAMGVGTVELLNHPIEETRKEFRNLENKEEKVRFLEKMFGRIGYVPSVPSYKVKSVFGKIDLTSSKEGIELYEKIVLTSGYLLANNDFVMEQIADAISKIDEGKDLIGEESNKRSISLINYYLNMIKEDAAQRVMVQGGFDTAKKISQKQKEEESKEKRQGKFF